MGRRSRRRGAHSAPRRRDREPDQPAEAADAADGGQPRGSGPTADTLLAPVPTDDGPDASGSSRPDDLTGMVGAVGTTAAVGTAAVAGAAAAVGTADEATAADEPPSFADEAPSFAAEPAPGGSGGTGGDGTDGGGPGGGPGGGGPGDGGPDGPEGPGNGRRRRRRRRTAAQRALLVAIVLVAIALVALGSGYAYVTFRFDQVKKVSVPHLHRAPVGEPFNVLLIGSDSRSQVPNGQTSAFGNLGANGGQRSDVVKIVHIVPATGQASVLSIPRDTMVAIAGTTTNTGQYNRINATYADGPDQLVQTIQNNFGIPISHVVQVDFAGFEGAVNAVGGIYMSFPYPAKDAYSSLNITQTGCQLLNGFQALAVARSRHYQYEAGGQWQYDPTSDFGRIQRQNAFLRALIDQAETKYNPLTLNAFVGSVAQSLTIDSTFTVKDLVSLANEFHNFSSSSLQTLTLPTYAQSSYQFSYLGDVLYVQQPQAAQVIDQFLGGPPDPAPTPPPGPAGTPATTTTTSPTLPGVTTTTGGGTTPSTAGEETTTTIDTNYDPVPCSPNGG